MIPSRAETYIAPVSGQTDHHYVTLMGDRVRSGGATALSGNDVATVTRAHAVSIYSIYKVRAAAVDLNRGDGPGR